LELDEDELDEELELLEEIEDANSLLIFYFTSLFNSVKLLLRN